MEDLLGANQAAPFCTEMGSVHVCTLDTAKLGMQVGMPEVDDVVGATLNYKLRVARGNVRKFLESATEGVQLGQYGEVVTKILAAVDEIEEKTGAPLDAANEQGWKTLAKKVEVRATLSPCDSAPVRGYGKQAVTQSTKSSESFAV